MANRLLAVVSVSIEPTEPFDGSSMKLRRPLSMVATDQTGFQDSGWKLLKETQMAELGWNRPEGVNIENDGGL